jgi:5-methylcytosine-specific restriction protein A
MPIMTTCLICGTPIPRGTSRCRKHGYRKSKSGQPPRSNAERQRRKAAVDAWVEQHGYWCPGYGVPPHPSHLLQADHVQPVSLGGDPGGELRVLCRSCNVRKGGANRIRFPSSKSRPPR